MTKGTPVGCPYVATLAQEADVYLVVVKRILG